MKRREQKVQKKDSSSVAPLPEPLLTVDQVATWLGFRPATVYGMSLRGELPSIVVGRMVRFRKSEIEALLEANRRQVVTP